MVTWLQDLPNYPLNCSDSSQHAAYLSSLTGGSGSSTPSLDVKEEETDTYDDGACLSDEPINITDDNVHMVSIERGPDLWNRYDQLRQHDVIVIAPKFCMI